MSRALQSRSLADNIPDRADMEPEPAGQGQVWVRSAGMGTGAVGQSDGDTFLFVFFRPGVWAVRAQSQSSVKTIEQPPGEP